MKQVALLCVLMAAAVAAQQAPAAAGRVRIAAASDLRFALDEVVRDYRLLNPGARVAAIYGSSGNFHAQIAQGAPFDLFLSADADYPRDLATKGKADGSTLFNYALGRLVLWVPAGSPLALDTGMSVLLDARIRRIAIANPLHAPYGRAAEAAMRASGVWGRLEGKIVRGDSVTQAAQFVSTGAADIGVIARSLAFAPEMRARGRYWEVPPTLHAPLEQAGVVLNGAADRAAALAFRDYLRSEGATRVLVRHGFVLPK
jgi:molybdate transport system substrate-binding protein